jgi:chorismate mutase
MSTQATDPVVQQLRHEISDLDRSIVALVNKRLQLVGRIKRYKDEHGIPFLDPDREQWMLRYLERANGGPLSREGLNELYTQLLDLTKREVTRDGDAS